MRVFRRVSVYVLCGFVAACNSSTPVSPTPLAPAPPPIPSISGQWTGTYTTLSCNETGSAVNAGFCGAVGRAGGLALTPTQAGSSITGTLGIGTFNIPVTGNLDTRGVLILSGAAFIVQNFQLSLNTWQATVSGSSMTGTMTYTVLATVPPIGAVTVSSTTALNR